MTTIDIDTTAIAEFCRKHHIRRLALFGSALRGELRNESDIDLLVDFEAAHAPGYFTLVAMERELTELLGRKADLRTAEELNLRFRNEVVRESREIYAAR